MSESTGRLSAAPQAGPQRRAGVRQRIRRPEAADDATGRGEARA